MQTYRWVSLFLFVVIAVVLGFSVPVRAQESSAQPVVKQAAAAQLGPVPNLPDCLTAAAENGDPAKGPSVLLAKLAAGCDVPWHWHTPNEHLMVVSGALRLQAKGQKSVLMRRGDYGLMPSHHVHRAHCSGSADCTFFLYSDGTFDIHYVDKAEKEIPLAEALQAVKTTPAKSKSK